MSNEIREFAMRLAKEAGGDCHDGYTYLATPGVLERFFRAAMREGMMRAAIHIDVPWARMGTDFADAIRAEADKLEGK